MKPKIYESHIHPPHLNKMLENIVTEREAPKYPRLNLCDDSPSDILISQHPVKVVNLCCTCRVTNSYIARIVLNMIVSIASFIAFAGIPQKKKQCVASSNFQIRVDCQMFFDSNN